MGIIVGLLLGSAIFALLAAIPLKIAFRVVLKSSMEFGEAFKLMFFAGILANIANAAVTLAGLSDGMLGTAISSGVLFVAVSFMLLHSAGLELGQSLAVGAVMTLLFFGFMLVLGLALASALESEEVSTLGPADWVARA